MVKKEGSLDRTFGEARDGHDTGGFEGSKEKLEVNWGIREITRQT